MTDYEIDYPRLVDEALRDVARGVLARAAVDGLPGEHHFYISFRTDHPDLQMPPSLRASYPEEMTIILQNQFWDLAVDDEGFEVMLRFGGEPHHLRVPWMALKSFVDPEAEFGLRFDALEAEPVKTDEDESPEDHPEGPGDVISFEEFRRRDD